MLLKTTTSCILYIVIFLALHSDAKKSGKSSKRKHKNSFLETINLSALTLKTEKDTTIGLLHETDVRGVLQVDASTWKWKTRSSPMPVKDSVVNEVLSGLNNSLTLSMEVRGTSRRTSSLFHAYSNFNGVGPTSWIELLIDQSENTFKVRYRTGSLVLSTATFILPETGLRSWIKIFLSINTDIITGSSKISFQAGCSQAQEQAIVEGVNLILPKDLKIEIGGNSENADVHFTGQMRRVLIYSHPNSTYPWSCDVTSAPSKPKETSSKPKVRGSSSQSPGTRKRKNASRREASRANLNLNVDNNIEGILDELRAEIVSCRTENRDLNSMMQMMKQKQSSLENRISVLETCECIPMCLMKDGVKRRHGEVWEINECKSCECTGGETACESRDGCDAEVHACLSSPCSNGGDCEEIEDTYHCSCRRGFYGEHCEHIDRCAYGICENGAECELLSEGGYQCHCRVGFTGIHCGKSEDNCLSRPCLNGGRCNNSPTGFTCDCRAGFSGRLCADDECSDLPCQNGGYCTTLAEGGYTCRCQRPYYGKNCELRDACYSSPCSNGGTCLRNPLQDDPNIAEYTCTCPDPFFGPRCEHRDACYINPCLNGGKCLSESREDPTHYTCNCRDGFYGSRCERRDECLPNPCLNGGRCFSESLNGGGTPHFTCTCREGFYGSRCELKDNCFPNPCLNGAQCLSENESPYFTCTCRDGFYGTRCEDQDACFTNPCQNGGRCTRSRDDASRYTCTCRDGFYGTRCEDQDACFTNPCQNGGRCTRSRDHASRYTCTCRDGFYGSNCEDEDSCFRNPCLNGGRCSRDLVDASRYTCNCRDGFDGSRCEEEDACFRNPCLNGGRCIRSRDDASEYTCTCRDGFYGSRCESEDSCSRNPCLNGGRCIRSRDDASQFTCTCRDGFHGSRCENEDACFRNPCLNGGRCIRSRDDASEYTCTCKDGFYGSRCEEEDACFRNPCLNGGRCIRGRDASQYTCTCIDGFYGSRCEEEDACHRNPCLNRGRCSRNVDDASGYTCTCRDGFYGSRCENEDSCFRNPCLNGGRCIRSNDDASEYTCTCKDGFYGSRCESEDGCFRNPCLNGGRCIRNRDDASRFTCTCRDGFYGSRCEDRDSCFSNPCLNGGRCSKSDDSASLYTCTCRDGFHGPRCENEDDACFPNPCLNGGRCTKNDLSALKYTCECPASYSGDRCELHDACSSSPCLNGGRCQNIPSTDIYSSVRYSCQCEEPYSGFRCEIENLNPCAVNPCQNGGVCEKLPGGGFRCRCRQTHFGEHCELTDYCRANPCKNRGICMNKPSKYNRPYTCNCRDMFIGPVCEYEDLCRRNPCLNGGTCRMEDGDFVCQCTDSYSGRRCERVDFCGQNICLNGGRCENDESGSGFRCICPESHVGNRCQQPHPCRPNPCLNNGQCRVLSEGGYSCECPPSHHGPNCRLINYCRSNPCLNGGTCINNRRGFVCDCPPGYGGINCVNAASCASNPCKNGATCVEEDGIYKCICPNSHHGATCQYRCNVCAYNSEEGICEGSEGTPETRWYFNKFSQSCEQFRYSGCGGNGNNFATRQACKQRCLVGACCMLRHSSVHINGHSTTVPASYSCQSLSIGQCKRMDTQHREIQVISFKPGMECSAITCGNPSTCSFGGKEYEINSRISVGCSQSCICRTGGYMDCSCGSKSVRREIRQLTTEERIAFKSAVETLKMSDIDNGANVWDKMRDEYVENLPIAQSTRYFLLWNRGFLRKMELLLQNIDCTLNIPYYDFTLDCGNMKTSVIWQPNFFGGEGDCVPDHPFRTIVEGEAMQWKPCLSRSFNKSIPIPNMIDISSALNSQTYEQLSGRLQTLISYFNAFTGGDMMSSTRAYDPLFYSVHAYIDHIFMIWQKNNPGRNELQHVLGVNDMRFVMSPTDLWDGACVTYAGVAYRVPCNRSDTSEELFATDGYNLQGYDRQGFDRDGFDKHEYNALGQDRYGRHDTRGLYRYDGYNAEGYNKEGYDRRGCNRFGFDKENCDRDGFNTEGYDRAGFSRYGLDALGFDRRGYNMYGLNSYGKLDGSEFFDAETGYNDCCFGRDGLTPSGYDRFGFNVEGYDTKSCEHFFHGPHSPHYREKLWKMLSVQPLSFLSSVSRTCGPLGNLPKSHLSLNWVRSPSYHRTLQNRRASARDQIKANSVNKEFSERFCFDVDMFLTWCPCLEENYPAICSTNPCENAFCDLHREARCVVNMCGQKCTAEYFFNGRRVNCDNPCSPNPCQNGGTCEPSRFSSASERFQCTCPDEYVGSLCEKLAPDTCMLSLKVGNCRSSVRRWFYNFMTASCQEFIYSGCGGNSNNFPSKKACDLRCSLGACCYRLPKNSTFLVGFDRDGYDKYGFNALGYNRGGQQQSAHDSMPTGNRIHAPKGYGPDGYDIYGYDRNGYDRQGYDRDGFHRDTGYNRTGFNPDGDFDQLMEFEYDGYNRSGRDRAGYTCNGVDRQGFNQLGLYYDFKYHCESLLLSECEALKDPGQLEIPFEVISFSPGKTCDEVHCADECGCKVQGEIHPYGHTFEQACQTCTCTLGGLVECTCQRLGKRREIRDLTESERSAYAAAVRKLYKSDKWGDFATQHAEHMPQANGNAFSLPWHRNFIRMVEMELQKVSSCEVFIPYFDWTIDVGNLSNSQIWQANFFGGNGEEDSNCVRNHLFAKDVQWHPCIKRRFNESMSLPNAVNFHLLLHEPKYDDFRLQLEMMSALFHLWVGGHMASPFSPYDPLYLSHWAFIDQIWDKWQKKNPMGIARFPAQQRYTTMKPFDVTPDNVLSSEQQICVIYIPPTLGSNCNVTNKVQWPPSIYDKDGLDRHGFNTLGFDTNGFNVQGRNRYGRKDTRIEYNNEGYNEEGYHRSGFDKSGWDKHNYNKFNFNRDGFDIERYDASGYDRYGFDRSGKTPFGMFMNTSFAPGFDRGYASSLFDRFGFNKYGYDRNGFDHNGYDAFGFDMHGLDRDNCDYYNGGPHYMRYYYYALDQLSMMGKEMLKNVKRVCPPITPLPDYWISHIWLENLPVARNFEKLWGDNHVVDMSWKPRSSSVTEDLVWLPITPDQELCFNLDWYSGCLLGTTLMECSVDLCSESTCASQPYAQCRTKNCGACYPEFFNGRTGEIYQCYGCVTNTGTMHNEGSKWLDGCNTCVCQAGLISCSPIPCPSVTCSHPAPAPNQCCDVCNSCEYSGRIYHNRQEFRPDSCKICDCVDGSVMCHNVETSCPPVTCEMPVTMPGECCPSCPTDCHGHRDGDTWAMDKCHNCTCVTNRIICSENQCPVVMCKNPRKSPDECCPECQGCEYQGQKYRNQQNFMKDSCTQCSCRFGNVMCTTQQCPPLSCVQKETLPGSCCPRCRQGCEYEGIFYDNGVSFEPQNNPCLECSCQEGEPRCFRRTCPRVQCARPSIPRGECCPKCASCRVGSVEYREGQMWTSSDRCQKCVCQHGEEICRNIIPCRDTCSHGVRQRRGQCCADCHHCSYHGKIFRHLEPFTDPTDFCKSCTCQSGNVVCSDTECPEVQCGLKETPTGECCQRCKSCVYDGELKEHGASWRIPQDLCTTCSCREGRVECSDERCPPARCDYPRMSNTSCCPTCEGCTYRGKNYDERGLIDSESCSTCRCMHGNVLCRDKSCPRVDCTSPIRKSGECCPSCASCSYEGKDYEDEATFIAPRSPCLQCKCQGGRVNCQRLDLDCPVTRCPNPGRTSSQCCPTCDSCEYERRNYDSATTFTPMGGSPCLTCTCLAGRVRCNTQTCPPISCSNPVTELGNCCPVCEECIDDGITYRNGQRWQMDACTICQCIAGIKECNPVFCTDVACSHPAKMASDCCPTCDKCLYNGRVYSDGRQFPNPTDRCSVCTCRTGSVTCRRRICPRLDCDTSVNLEGSCCPTCPTDCVLNGFTILNGDTVHHPEEKCKECTCTDGKVECGRRQCPVTVPCSNPSSDGCCRDQCNDCRYQGKQVKNGQTVAHSTDSCRSCTCTDGNIICIRQRCSRAACDDPQKLDGSCCSSCPEPLKSCNYNGETAAHGEQFKDGCKVCLCQDGVARCRAVQCSGVTCSSPMKKGCCLSCDGCKVNGTNYNNDEEVPNISMNSCDTCNCIGGDVICRARRCPDVHCPDPRVDGCCPACVGCSNNGEAYADGDTFSDPDNPCDICTCSAGTISCSRRPCHQSACTHPLKPETECCPVCGGDCLFEGGIYKDDNGMFSPASDTDECQLCVCSQGSVICKDKPCPKASCRHPIQNKCGCPICESCLYNGIERENRETFSNPENEKCSDCYCSSGNVVCGNRRCESPSCTHPVRDDCNCPQCDQCLYYGTIYNNEVDFPDVRDECNHCTCQDGNVQCGSRVCEEVTCSYPSQDDCGCQTCDGCSYAGVDHDNGEQFIDSINKCNECICQSGGVICSKIQCETPPCSNPVMSADDCCPKCIGMCHVEGKLYEDGATFTKKSDPCSICSCSSGDYRCVRQRCDVRCQNPIARSECCPDCSACLYEGVRHEEGDIFLPKENSCKQCSCLRGNILCTFKQCPEPECENPQNVHGECCPQCAQALSNECIVDGRPQRSGATWTQNDNDDGVCQECRCLASGTVSCTAASCENTCTHPVPNLGRCCSTCDSCYYGNHTYQNGAMFQPDRCKQCICKAGNVKCTTSNCPPLSCPINKQLKGPGDCCPQCVSCVISGQRYSDGESWSAPTDPCSECHCLNGVVTCAQLQCLQPCQTTITVLGQCCPVCAGCFYNNKIYNIGESFEPNMRDPCEICECQATQSGASITSCKRRQCPSLADCPRSCIQQPRPGKCCPTCTNRAECAYGFCTAVIAGQQIVPADNRCYSCECKSEETWLCMREPCKTLNCAVNKRYTPQGSCCPICDECHLDHENIDVPSGKVWHSNECEMCRCEQGTIMCMQKNCPAMPLQCELGTIPYKQPGQCCHECLNADASCMYEGRTIQTHHTWKTDACTTCTCFSGKLKCVTQKCRMLMCSADQSPTTVSGECCPKCMLRSATCVAFGDPHYRTFDGRMVNFQGPCQYLLTADCSTSDFKIIVHNSNHGGLNRRVSWTDQVTIITEGGTIAIMRDYTLRVNGTAVSHLPLSILPYYYVEIVGNYLLLTTHLGVQISWNGRHRLLEVSVPGEYRRRTCGLCGNFNNYPQDDARLHNSRLATSDAEFGNDWKVTIQNAPLCPDAADINPCDGVNFAQRKIANEKCKVLRSPAFAACHSMVNPDIYYSTCVYDTCSCGENDQTCLCDVLESYAAQCRRAGVVIRWRNPTLCSIVCPYDRGYVFDECGSPCKRTCANRNLPPGALTEQCYLPCVSGCQCPTGKVEHAGRCIYPDHCPATITSGIEDTFAAGSMSMTHLNLERRMRSPLLGGTSRLIQPPLRHPTRHRMTP